MVKTYNALRHMSVKEFSVEFLHEKVSRDLGCGTILYANKDEK